MSTTPHQRYCAGCRVGWINAPTCWYCGNLGVDVEPVRWVWLVWGKEKAVRT